MKKRTWIIVSILAIALILVATLAIILFSCGGECDKHIDENGDGVCDKCDEKINVDPPAENPPAENPPEDNPPEDNPPAVIPPVEVPENEIPSGDEIEFPEIKF